MTILSCPVCRAALLREDTRYACANGHGFDRARQGYVNLLLSSQRPSKAPGDSAAMLADRRAFLDAGFYDPLRRRIVERLDTLRGDGVQRVLDLGCGEGYYSAGLTDAARDVYALDIAKPALALAARRNPQVTWCVGNSRALPFFDDSLDVVLSIFCCPHPAQTRRVLRADGVLLLVGPGPSHLEELRAILYDTVRTQHSQTPERLREQGFVRSHSEILDYRFTLDGVAIGQLARMTPHYWRAPAHGRARLEGIDTLTLRADFVIQEFAPRKMIAAG